MKFGTIKSDEKVIIRVIRCNVRSNFK